MLNKRIIVKNFSRYASTYDQYSDIQQTVARYLLNELPDAGVHNILEVGCGTGYYTALLQNKYPQVKITALDISAEMIKYSRGKLAAGNIDFVVADGEEIKLDGKYNLITANAVFQWFERLPETITYYRNCLREGGLLAFSFFGPQTFCELRKALSIYFQKDMDFTSASFATKDDLEKLMRKDFMNFSIDELFIKTRSSSLLDLLTRIKYTGTNGYGIKERVFWNEKLLQAVEEVYRKEFGDIEITSHVFICKGNL